MAGCPPEAGAMPTGLGEAVLMKNFNLLKVLGVIVLMGGWLSAGFSTLPAQAAGPLEPKKTIAVVEFAVRGGDLDPQAGAIIADSMTSAIASLGYFTLKDRMSLSAIAKIAQNNQLGSIGPIDAETAMQLGKLYGIHGVVTGTISKLGDRIKVTARLIDTRTGAILRSGEIEDQNIDAVQIKLNEVVLAITTTPISPTQSWRALTVKTEPPNALVKLLNVNQPYQAGIRLPAGVYEIEVSHPGYVTQKATAKIAENDATLLIHLEEVLYTLTVEVKPPESQINIVNMLDVHKPYQPGMKLEAGVYQLEIACRGYRTEHKTITIRDADVSMMLNLEPQPGSPTAAGSRPPTPALQPRPAVPVQQKSVKKTPPPPTRSVAVRQKADQPAPKRMGGNRANWPNPREMGNGAFRQGWRKFREDLKRALW